MVSLAGLYLFLLGLASGCALLTITSYRHVSPTWLKWLLIVSGVFVISRYVTMALFTMPHASQYVWSLRHCWFATSVGLTLPSVFAVDQLLRHPAMSPRKLLRWFSPFLASYAALILFATMRPAPDRVVGWMPQLSSGWLWLISITQALFVLLFIGLCALFMHKVPSRPIRLALLGLVFAHAYLGLDGVLLALGRWYFRPFLFSEMLTLLALWHAYETSACLQQHA